MNHIKLYQGIDYKGTMQVFVFVGTNFRGFYKCIDPWLLEFVVSNTKGNNQLKNCSSLDFNFRGLSQPLNPRKLESHD